MTLAYRLVRAMLRPILWLYFRRRIVGRSTVPREGGLLIVSNHVSYLDPALIACSTARPCHFFARASLFRFPVFGALLRRLQAIPVERGGGQRAALQRSVEILQTGNALVLFPEGTRSSDGSLGEFESGVGLLATKANVPILTVYLEGAHRALPRGAHIPRPKRITVRWGTCRTPEEWATRCPHENRPSRAIAAALREEISALGSGQSARMSGK